MCIMLLLEMLIISGKDLLGSAADRLASRVVLVADRGLHLLQLGPLPGSAGAGRWGRILPFQLVPCTTHHSPQPSVLGFAGRNSRLVNHGGCSVHCFWFPSNAAEPQQPYKHDGIRLQEGRVLVTFS